MTENINQDVQGVFDSEEKPIVLAHTEQCARRETYDKQEAIRRFGEEIVKQNIILGVS